MSNIKPIYWHQGLFLKPHHFQYLQAYSTESNNTRQENKTPYAWGVSKFSVDKKELLTKNFVIEELEIVFVDGTVVNLPHDAVVQSRNFSTLYEDLESDLTIYVGLKNFSENNINVTELNSYENLENVDTRFVTKGEASSVNNLYHEDESAQVQFMDYCLKIFFEDEIKNLNSYQLIPIAKIERKGEDIFLNEKYVAPLLEAKANTSFFELINSIQKDLTFRAFQLEEYKNPSSNIGEEPNYLKYLMALQSLAIFVPKIKHMSKAESLHPWYYYELFVQLVGVLSTYSTRVNIFGKLDSGKYLIQEYNHLNLYEIFYEIKLLVTELLDSIIIGPDYILPFVKNETTFTLDCPVSIFQAKYRYFLIVKTPSEANELQESFARFAKVASSNEIEMIVERSLVGLPFEKYEMSIQGLPQRSDSCYFELTSDDAQWGHIQQSQNMTIEFDDALDDVSVELVVLKK